jgi:phosphate transport system protein
LNVRERFTIELHQLEERTLECLDGVAETLDHAVAAMLTADRPRAGRCVAEIDQLERHATEVETELLTFIARQSPVARDLRVTAALIEIVGDAQRMAHQCMSIAKLVTLFGPDSAPDDECVRCLERMGEVAHDLIVRSREGFAARTPELSADLDSRDDALDRANRECFRIALRISADRSVREWAMCMMLSARALERVGDNAVSVARQIDYMEPSSTAPAA